MRSTPIGLAALTALAVAGCGKPAPASAVDTKAEVAVAAAPPPAVPAHAPALSGFHHDPAVDGGGYYMPSAPVDVGGGYRLTNLSIAPPEEFAKWDKGERIDTYAPVMLEFEDVNSPEKMNEMGQNHHVVQARVLPTAYSIDKDRIRFVGHDSKLGDVSFDGTLDAAALASARRQDVADAVVVRGTLTVGSKRLNGLAFTFFLGD